MKTNDLLRPETWAAFYTDFLVWFEQQVLALDFVIQVGILIVSLILAYFIQKPIQPRLSAGISKLRLLSPLRRVLGAVSQQLFAIAVLCVLWLETGINNQIKGSVETGVLEIIASLMTAWILIRLTSAVIANPFLSRLVAIFAWTIAALNIVGLLGPAINVLESVSISLGQTRVSVLTIINGALLLAALMWTALAVSKLIENRLAQISEITPGARVLIGKTVRLIMVVVAVMVALSSVGINFAALAVFTGAVGVGIGIGLQKQVSNLISGVILLLDKSIKPGDVIEVGPTFGWVNTMSARYVGVTTRDNKELLIPNDDFVTNQVINWSHSDNDVRMEVKFGTSYDSDPHTVRELAVAAAEKPARVVDYPPPVCHLKEFGDSSLNFVLRFWIRDPAKGVTNVKGLVLLALWDSLKEHNIQIPYPQQVVHLAPGTKLSDTKS
ncbi:MAG: mechanosensitive ion channel [Rhodospirillaceae bacterium]|jgi:small-conductance mechanosensitive channel|nr:mechanosensitive ion channel [Rhodospirillaceae bacterium]